MRLTPPSRRRPDPTLTLINVIFLMLLFFMVAGRLAPPRDPDLTLVQARSLEAAPPPDALVLHEDGRLSYRGEAVEAAAHVAALPPEESARLRLVPDRAVPASRLVEIAGALRAAGAGSVVLVAEQALR